MTAKRYTTYTVAKAKAARGGQRCPICDGAKQAGSLLCRECIAQVPQVVRNQMGASLRVEREAKRRGPGAIRGLRRRRRGTRMIQSSMGNGQSSFEKIPGCNLPLMRGRVHPHYKPIGTLEVYRPKGGRRPCVRIKVADSGPWPRRWRYLAVVVWERANGPIPAGRVLWHRNGNPMDCGLANLECITLAERLRRNIAANLPACHAAWSKQAQRNGRLYWEAALDARRLKAWRRQQASGDAGRIKEATHYGPRNAGIEPQRKQA